MEIENHRAIQMVPNVGPDFLKHCYMFVLLLLEAIFQMFFTPLLLLTGAVAF